MPKLIFGLVAIVPNRGLSIGVNRKTLLRCRAIPASVALDHQSSRMTITLPAFPAKILQKQLRKNAETHEVYGGGNDLVKTILR